MRLMTGHAIDWSFDFGEVARFHHVRNRMAFDRMAQIVLQRQYGYLGEIPLGQFHLAVKDRHQMITLHLNWLGVRSMTLEAQFVWSGGTQQVEIISAVRFMTGETSLHERWLVKMRFLLLLCLLAVASQADIYCIWLLKSGRVAGVGIMAISAIACGAWMLYLGLLYLFRLIRVTGDADFLWSGRDQHHFAVFGWGVTGVALATSKRHMSELGHQVLLCRLVRIMASQAIRRSERLPLMGLDQRRILRIVAVNTERRSILGQMKLKLTFATLTRLVGDVACVATHIQRSVATAIL